jgi:hypothetical protein
MPIERERRLMKTDFHNLFNRRGIPARLFLSAVICCCVLFALVFRGSQVSEHSHEKSADSLEALLPEVLEIVDEPGVIKVIVHPKLAGRAELNIEVDGDASAGRAAKESLLLQRGGAPIERRFAKTSTTPRRVGLVFKDEKGEITMSVHREIESAQQPAAGSGVPAISQVVTVSDGSRAITYFPQAPVPAVSESRP